MSCFSKMIDVNASSLNVRALKRYIIRKEYTLLLLN